MPYGKAKLGKSKRKYKRRYRKKKVFKGPGVPRDLTSYNRSPIPERIAKRFVYNTYVNTSTTYNVAPYADTSFYSMSSLYDPEYASASGQSRDVSVAYFSTFLDGGTTGKYTRFKVKYVDVYIKAISTLAQSRACLVISSTQIGTADYDSTEKIDQLKSRVHAYSMELENQGDATYKSAKVRVYPHKTLALTWRQYWDDDVSEQNFNAVGSVSPWIVISVGPHQPLTESSEVTYQLTLVYHVVLCDPFLEVHYTDPV